MGIEFELIAIIGDVLGIWISLGTILNSLDVDLFVKSQVLDLSLTIAMLG